MQLTDDFTAKIYHLILAKYGSLRHFCLQCDFPLSTLSDMMKNGVGNSRFDTVCFLCVQLGIALPSICCPEKFRCTEQLALEIRQMDHSGIKNVLSACAKMNKI